MTYNCSLCNRATLPCQKRQLDSGNFLHTQCILITIANTDNCPLERQLLRVSAFGCNGIIYPLFLKEITKADGLSFVEIRVHLHLSHKQSVGTNF